jgi:MFS-type transporter involved in bile tolerance (Atg22 family)
MFFLSEEKLAERERKRQERVRRLGVKLRNWCNVDNIVDASVDLFLILFDVLSSPILIVMRLVRFVIGNYLLGGVKNKIKKVAHWVEDKHIIIKIVVWTLIICVAGCILTLMWIFGQAFAEFIMEEWGHQAIEI